MMKPKRIEKVVKISIVIIMASATALMVLGVVSFFYFTHDLPSIETLKNYRPPAITKIFSEDGEIIAEFFIEKREVVSLDRIPHHLVLAFIAGEDARFFHHKGLDYVAIFRAFFRNIFSGDIVQGGSTITQQVVKSILLSPEKSFTRKIREAILAFKIEKYLSKEEILYLYLNQIYLGYGAYGVASAAESYFGKPVEEVNLAESALLAGLPQAPSKYSPHHHLEQARRRQTYILNRMLQEGFISDTDFSKALHTPLKIKDRQNSLAERTPYFVEHIRKYIEEKYGKDAFYKNGLQVYTTIDLNFQILAQEAMESGLREIEKREKYLPSDAPSSVEGALVCFDLETGYVKAMVGGRNYKRSQFNRVTQGRRQTGSAFKPIVYSAALDKGYTPASVILDAPLTFAWGDKKWMPKNFENKFFGPTTLRNAIARSVNIVTVKIAQNIGIDYIRDYAQRLGISASLQNDLSMALGSSSISLYELTRAYAVFANQGKVFHPIFIKRILDKDGNLLEENLPSFILRDPSDEEHILSPQTAYIMTNLLEGVVQNGTGSRAKVLGRPTAGKTGTTDQFMDAWFVGYTPEFVTGVWVGFDDEKSLGENETGSRAASPIWVNFMSKILKDKPPKSFPVPEGIEFMKIDSKTGQINSGREGFLECFKEGTGPTQKTSPRTSTDFFKFDLNLPTNTK